MRDIHFMILNISFDRRNALDWKNEKHPSHGWISVSVCRLSCDTCIFKLKEGAVMPWKRRLHVNVYGIGKCIYMESVM